MHTLKIPLTLIATFGLFSACSKNKVPVDPKPRPVITHTVSAPTPELTRSFSGVSQAADSAELSFEIGGRIIKMSAAAGTRYAKGMVLAELDTSSVEAQLRQAQAEATRAKEELKRVQQLFETDNASKAQLDQVIAAQKSAAAALETAAKNVSHGKLRMPYDGVISEVMKEKQEVVSAGTPVIRIQGEGSMEIEIGVTAEYINAVKPGMKTQAIFPSISKKAIPATVSKVSPQSSDNTTYAVTLVINGKHPNLRDGLDADVSLSLPNPRGAVISVPVSCVAGTAGGQRYVLVVNKSGQATGTVERREVKIGVLSEGASIEILKGLSEGDIILSRGVHRIEPGTKVRID